ncbi:MAG: TonB-dependent receptor [Deltaproteobacteria bacterium]|nr:TonB-dependent receptor [Deltaproteobacteria bacterium]MBW1987466.1 TonB-dependent receptor [Deltaproteobacteria bacterium]MBW2135331.1 TonB-dependent receptor [Deltaproteobacteria bacterium]
MARRGFIAGLCLIFLVFAQAVGAAATPETQGTQERATEAFKLEEITVIAPQPGVEITTDKTIIRMDQFKKPGYVRTLEDVLQEIGGIDVLRHNALMASPGDEIAIRGLSEGRLVVEIDGRRINHTGHFGRYVVDWSTLSLDDIDRVEIIRGAHSVLHPFAIGGVINIITKKGQQTDQVKPDVSISSGYSSFNTYFNQGSIDGGLFNRVGYHFSLSRQSTDGFLRNNFQWNNNFAGGLQFFLPYEAKLWLGFRYSKVNYGFPVINDPSRPDFDPDYPPFIPIGADALRHLPATVQLPGPPIPQWNKNTYYLDGILTVPLGPGTSKVHAYTTDGRRDIHFYRFMGGKNVFVHADTRDVTKGILAEYRDVKLVERDYLKNYLTVGFDYQLLGMPPQNPIIYLVKSAYLQDVAKLWNRLTFTAGVRYYNIQMDTYYAWFEQGKPAPAWPTAGKQQRESNWFPSFKLDVQVTPDTALYAAVSRALRLPCP